MSKNVNFKSLKSGSSVLKGLVTRTDDPLQAGRFQVFIPGIHEGTEPSDEMKGSGSNPGTYPWAQMTSVALGSKSPDIETWVWLAFEDGDIRSPIYVGTVSTIPLSSGDYGDHNTYLYNGATVGNYYPIETYNGDYGELIKIARRVIFSRESGGNYSAINWNDNGAISIGVIQWHAGRAKNLLKKIRNLNTNKFDNTCISFGATSLIDDINSSSNWSGYVLSSNSTKGQCLKSILESPESAQAQESQVDEDILSYFTAAMNDGVSDLPALVYVADIYNQYGTYGGALRSAIKSSAQNGTIDTIHSAVHNATSRYLDRRDSVYQEIKEIDAAGEFEKIAQKQNISGLNESTKVSANGTTIEYTGTNGQTISTNLTARSLLWPSPGYTHITSGFGYRDKFKTNQGYSGGKVHCGIDIGTPIGSSIVASHNGVVGKISMDASSSQGILIRLDAGNVHTLYQHLSKVLVTIGQVVSAGDIIALSGMTGNCSGPHLHFGLYLNGTNYYDNAVDPKPYLKI